MLMLLTFSIKQRKQARDSIRTCSVQNCKSAITEIKNDNIEFNFAESEVCPLDVMFYPPERASRLPSHLYFR